MKDYKHEPRTVKSQGRIILPGLHLKLYSMNKGTHPDSNSRLILDTPLLLRREVEEGRLAPLTGLGFAILSEDMLNVARWDTEYPIVLKNQIYGFEENILAAQELDIKDVGSFCVWELGIVSHERESWKKFLASKSGYQSEFDYLTDVMKNGEL